jgi:phosphinothricin acetyltransferase
MAMEVRPARREDMGRACEIYNHYILTSEATFEFEPHEVAAWERLFDEVIEPGKHLLLVATESDRVVGYVKTSDFHEREGYSTSVQLSVFVDPETTAKGIGTALYGAILPLLDGRWHRAYGGVALPNDSSVALHKRFGFTRCALHSEVGRKFDRFIDVAWFEKALD